MEQGHLGAKGAGTQLKESRTGPLKMNDKECSRLPPKQAVSCIASAKTMIIS